MLLDILFQFTKISGILCKNDIYIRQHISYIKRNINKSFGIFHTVLHMYRCIYAFGNMLILAEIL